MANIEQIKSLIKAYTNNDNDRFKTVVLQIAAHEARLGHDNVARELKKSADQLNNKHSEIVHLTSQNPMLLQTFPKYSLSDLIVSSDLMEKIERILIEYRNRNKLYAYGLTNRRKILLEGAPGTGKTLTASVIASQLSLPLFTVQMDKLVTKFMGETSVKLRQIFDSIQSVNAVYFFDEFDAIGADRSFDNEVGEMRRILNSFLQFMDNDSSESIIIAATNNQRLLDQALFRRFDDVLHYSLPTQYEIKKIFDYKLLNYDSSFKITSDLISNAEGLNHAEIVKVCDDAIKASILDNTPITTQKVILLLSERKSIYVYKEG